MAALLNSVLHPGDLHFSGCSMLSAKQPLGICSPMTLSFGPIRQRKARVATSKYRIAVRAASGDSGRPNSASIFVGGFVLGGLIVGALGCIYAPQISKVLVGTQRKDLMRRLPKFIYDEEKALEKTRKILEEKIEQLNAAIDDVSTQLRGDEAPNGTAVAADEIEAAT